MINPSFADPQCQIYQGNALEVLRQLPASSVDLAMTSPPYYNLRSYPAKDIVWGGDSICQHEWQVLKRKLHSGRGDAQSSAKYSEQSPVPDVDIEQAFCLKCNAWKGQLGQERTPDEFVSHLCDIFDAVKGVLKPEGCLFVNIDDSFTGSSDGLYAKSLIGIPERFVLEMMRRQWYRRNTVIWHQLNTMPQSVTDRFTTDFEYLYLFTQRPKYYFEQQFEPLAASTITRAYYNSYFIKTDTGIYGGMDLESQLREFGKIRSGELQERNKRCVWAIPTNPMGIEMCESCLRVYSRAEFNSLPKKNIKHTLSGKRPPGKIDQALEGRGQEVWKPICYCGASEWLSHYAAFPIELCITPILAGSPEGGIVLDPFSGTGTLAIAARRLGRKAILIDISDAYTKMATYRIQQEPLPLPVVTEKVESQPARQLRLFNEEELK